MSDTALPAAQPHGPLVEVFPDVWQVTGSFGFGPGLRIPRNMTVVRQGDELVIVNTVREGALGTVWHVL